MEYRWQSGVDILDDVDKLDRENILVDVGVLDEVDVV